MQQNTSSTSLNDFLAKGKNNMNKFVEIVVRCSIHKIGFHTDVKKMYKAVQPRQQHWCFQRYIWQNELDNRKIPEEKVTKTLMMYGVKPIRNQSERGLHEAARISAVDFLEITLYRRVHMLMIVGPVHKILLSWC